MKRFLAVFTLVALCSIAGGMATRAQPRAKLSPPATNEFVYISTPDGRIHEYRLTKAGTLLEFGVQVLPVEGMCLVAHPNQRYLYAITGGKDSAIFAFRRAPTGELISLGKAPLRVGRVFESPVIDPKGRFLYLSAEYGVVLIYKIAHNGAVEPDGDTQVMGTFEDIDNTDGTHLVGAFDDGSMVIDPNGRFAISYNTEGSFEREEDTLGIYRILPNGRFKQPGWVASRSEIGESSILGEVVFDRTGRHAYINAGGPTPCQIRANGSLSRRKPKHEPVGTNVLFIGWDRRLAFARNESTISLVQFAIQPDGSLVNPFFLPPRNVSEISVSHDGRFLLVSTYTSQQAGAIHVFAIHGPHKAPKQVSQIALSTYATDMVAISGIPNRE